MTGADRQPPSPGAEHPQITQTTLRRPEAAEGSLMLTADCEDDADARSPKPLHALGGELLSRFWGLTAC
jgi:hypothetical protein